MHAISDLALDLGLEALELELEGVTHERVLRDLQSQNCITRPRTSGVSQKAVPPDLPQKKSGKVGSRRKKCTLLYKDNQ